MAASKPDMLIELQMLADEPGKPTRFAPLIAPGTTPQLQPDSAHPQAKIADQLNAMADYQDNNAQPSNEKTPLIAKTQSDQGSLS